MQSQKPPSPEVTTLAERKSAEAARRRRAANAAARELAGHARAKGGRFVLFGSYASDAIRHDSDLDILVDFPPDSAIDAWLAAEAIGTKHAIPVDLHDARTTTAGFIARVMKSGIVLK